MVQVLLNGINLKKYLNDPKIFDIILIGSSIKEKTNPRDIDLILLTHEKQDKLIYELRKEKYHAENLLVKNLFKEKEVLKTRIGELDKRSAKILRERYGLDCEPMSVRKIGKELNLSGNGVHKIEKSSIKKLRKRLKSKDFFD